MTSEEPSSHQCVGTVIITPQQSSWAPEITDSSAEAVEVQKGRIPRELWDI